MLPSFMANTDLQPQQIVIQDLQPELGSSPEPSTLPSRSERFYSKKSSTTITDDLIEPFKKAFSTALSREKWLELVQSYPSIKNIDSFLITNVKGLGVGILITLFVVEGWSCSFLVFSWNLSGNRCLSVGIPSLIKRELPNVGQKFTKASLAPNV